MSNQALKGLRLLSPIGNWQPFPGRVLAGW